MPKYEIHLPIANMLDTCTPAELSTIDKLLCIPKYRNQIDRYHEDYKNQKQKRKAS